MGSKDTISVDIRTWNQCNVEHWQNDVKVVGDYNLNYGRVENIGQAVFKRYKRWDHQ